MMFEVPYTMEATTLSLYPHESSDDAP